MHIYATVSKSSKGKDYTWHFCNEGDQYFALRVAPEVKVLSCKDRDDLRTLFKTYLTDKRYGFAKVG